MAKSVTVFMVSYKPKYYTGIFKCYRITSSLKMMFALAKQAFPMRAYLQANGGSRRLTDEEIGVCTAEKTSVYVFLI